MADANRPLAEQIADCMEAHKPTTKRFQHPCRGDVYLNKPACRGCEWTGEGSLSVAHNQHISQIVADLVIALYGPEF